MSKNNREKSWDKPKAPAPASSSSKADASPKPKTEVSAPVTYAGDSAQGKFLWIGIILLVLGWLSQGGKIGGQSALPKQPPICSDAKSVQVQPSGSATQSVRPDCLSGLIFTNNPSGYEVNFKVYGNVDVCFWDEDHCSGWKRLSVDNMIQTEAKKLPKYSAFRLVGDSGVVEIRLFKK